MIYGPNTLTSQRAFNRRQIVATSASFLAAPYLASCASTPQKPLKVGALFAGRIDDNGFMEAGWRGLEKARAEFGIEARHIDRVQPRKELLAAALTDLAQSGVDLVIAHGGQNNEACAEVAARFAHIKFVVTQGAVVAPNLASYDVLQEDSAYLAGVLAALVTRTGVVGHMSGIRVRPGLKGRAGYAAGVRATNPSVKLLTNFSGNQDDNDLSRKVALAQMAAGADVIFTMLNAGRDGVSQACREKGTRQIGNVIDWVAVDSQVFVASAMADVGRGVYQSVQDLRQGQFPQGLVRKVGIADPQAVRLSMAASVSAEVRAKVIAAAEGIASKRILVPEEYAGPEFATP
jgi:basic membrane protein A and related proteins